MQNNALNGAEVAVYKFNGGSATGVAPVADPVGADGFGQAVPGCKPGLPARRLSRPATRRRATPSPRSTVPRVSHCMTARRRLSRRILTAVFPTSNRSSSSASWPPGFGGPVPGVADPSPAGLRRPGQPDREGRRGHHLRYRRLAAVVRRTAGRPAGSAGLLPGCPDNPTRCPALTASLHAEPADRADPVDVHR